MTETPVIASVCVSYRIGTIHDRHHFILPSVYLADHLYIFVFPCMYVRLYMYILARLRQKFGVLGKDPPKELYTTARRWIATKVNVLERALIKQGLCEFSQRRVGKFIVLQVQFLQPRGGKAVPHARLVFTLNPIRHDIDGQQGRVIDETFDKP